MRAEREAETRTRIARAAVGLHETIGPARTTMSAVAEAAGVPRSTVYRHFPDEVALLAGCSAHWLADHVAPDPSAWLAIADPEARVRAALSALYGYYRTAAPMLDKCLRDAPIMPALGRMMANYQGYLETVRGVLAGEPAGRPLRAALGHALKLSTWQSLAAEGLSDAEAASLMAALVSISSGTGRT